MQVLIAFTAYGKKLSVNSALKKKCVGKRDATMKFSQIVLMYTHGPKPWLK